MVKTSPSNHGMHVPSLIRELRSHMALGQKKKRKLKHKIETYNKFNKRLLVAEQVKNLPAKRETGVWFLGRKDPLEKGEATHSSIYGLPWWPSWLKSLPAMRETWVRSLGWEDPLEEGMATPPVFWPGESDGQRSLVGYSPWGRKESDISKQLNTAQRVKIKIKKKMFWSDTKNWVDVCCTLNTKNWVNVYTVRFQSDLWNRLPPFSLTISVIFICGFTWMGASWWEKDRQAEKVLLLRV